MEVKDNKGGEDKKSISSRRLANWSKDCNNNSDLRLLRTISMTLSDIKLLVWTPVPKMQAFSSPSATKSKLLSTGKYF